MWFIFHMYYLFSRDDTWFINFPHRIFNTWLIFTFFFDESLLFMWFLHIVYLFTCSFSTRRPCHIIYDITHVTCSPEITFEISGYNMQKCTVYHAHNHRWWTHSMSHGTAQTKTASDLITLYSGIYNVILTYQQTAGIIDVASEVS